MTLDKSTGVRKRADNKLTRGDQVEKYEKKGGLLLLAFCPGGSHLGINMPVVGAVEMHVHRVDTV